MECHRRLRFVACCRIPTRAHKLDGARLPPLAFTATEVNRNGMYPVCVDDGEVVILVWFLWVDTSRAWGMTQLHTQAHVLQSRPLEEGAGPDLGGTSTQTHSENSIATYLDVM